MNSFELNKILGAILGTCLVLLALNITAGAVFAPQKPAKPGFDIAVKEAGEEKGGAATKEPEQPIETLLAKASVEKGQAAAKQCQACHTFEKGGPNRVGPNLWNVVNRARASEAGFNYSAAMKGKGGNWSFDELNKFLANPRCRSPRPLKAHRRQPRASRPRNNQCDAQVAGPSPGHCDFRDHLLRKFEVAATLAARSADGGDRKSDKITSERITKVFMPES